MRDKRAPVYACFPVSWAKRAVRERTVELWQARYLEDRGGGAVTKLFFRDISTAYRTIAHFPIDNLTSLVLTGHGGIKQYLHRFKLADSPLCVCGLGEPETIVHVLLECPRFARERLDIEFKIGRPLVQMSEIMEDWRIGLVFLEYARRVIRAAAKANGSTVV